MHTLVIDLNNFSRFPTLSVGYLSSVLKKGNITVDVLSPFSKGVKGYPRLVQAKPWEVYLNFLKHWSSVNQNKAVAKIRKLIQNFSRPGGNDDSQVILKYAAELLKNDPDVVLISTYTMYHNICQEICKLCFEKNISVIIGGSYFVEPKIAKSWSSMLGVSAIYIGEPESDLIKIVSDLSTGKDISHYPGVLTSGKQPKPPTQPLSHLDKIPFPDFSDFPWSLYPNRVIPLMTSRGCGWGKCTFCSDIVTSSGRDFHSRGIENVMQEITFQHLKFNSSLFVFLDLKLNSNLILWRELISRFPTAIPNAQWTASIHVDNRSNNGLSKLDLQRAHDSGLVRLTFGLESGSPKILKLMAKGINLKRVSTFLKDAYSAGISVRITCIIGYPGEDASDIRLTAQFIDEHKQYIERIVLNRFVIMPGTVIDKKLKNKQRKFSFIKKSPLNLHSAIIPYNNLMTNKKDHYLAIFQLMKVIHTVNRHPLKESAREFEGVM